LNSVINQRINTTKQHLILNMNWLVKDLVTYDTQGMDEFVLTKLKHSSGTLLERTKEILNALTTWD